MITFFHEKNNPGFFRCIRRTLFLETAALDFTDWNDKILTPFSPSEHFPELDEADDRGLLGVGGDMTPDWLIDAYSHGIFPWPFENFRMPGKYHLGWFCVEPRCIIEFDGFYVSRRLARTARSGKFTVTSDKDFYGVITSCAEGPNRLGGTWITPELIEAYMEFHRLGYAHSIETWYEGRLVGGVYGASLRGLFSAESMFYRERDASKIALLALVRHLARQGFQLLDIQVASAHTLSLGAVEISRDDYLLRLHEALQVFPDFGSVRSIGG